LFSNRPFVVSAADTNCIASIVILPDATMQEISGNLVVLSFLLDFFTHVYCITTPD
jgi:hypothetical protein